MRPQISTSFVFASLLVCASCNDSGTPPLPSASCGASQEMCNGQCVTTGTCKSTGVGGSRAGSSTTKKSTGGSKTTTADGEGGTESTDDVTGQGGQGEGGTSEDPDTTAEGGTPANGGTSSKGGSSSKGGTTAKGGSSSKASTTGSKGGTTSVATTTKAASTYVDDPTKCNDTATTKMDTDAQYYRGNVRTQDPNRTYGFHTNWWGAYNNPLIVLDGLSFTVTKNSGSSSDGMAPAGFPSFFVGTYQGLASKGSNLPKQVSAIKSIPTLLESNMSSAGDLNVSYDVWFTSGSAVLGADASDPGGSGRLMMIWLFDPSSKQPRGNKTGSASIAGKNWDVWQDSVSGRAPCRSYVPQAGMSSLPQFDLKDFIDDSVKAGFISSSMYLSIIFGGTEIWSGSGVQIKNFCAKVY